MQDILSPVRRAYNGNPQDSQNGDIEVFVESFEVLNHAKIDLPFYPSHSASELRLVNENVCSGVARLTLCSKA
jgi:hypothetical protein